MTNSGQRSRLGGEEILLWQRSRLGREEILLWRSKEAWLAGPQDPLFGCFPSETCGQK